MTQAEEKGPSLCFECEGLALLWNKAESWMTQAEEKGPSLCFGCEGLALL